ncbi:MAG: 2-oxoacid:acceptor oxidoreductase family protein [Pseudomonadota bacterium]
MFDKIRNKMSKNKESFPFPGTRMAMDGNEAVIMCEREASDGAGAYPITPSTQMGEYWAEEVAKGHLNTSDKPLIFVEPESEHAAAAVTAGMAMTGLRAVNFSSAQGVAFMHESLYAAAGKRLPYVLNIGCRAITKASLNVHCGHDDYHCVDDTGFIQVMARDAQEAADLNLIMRKVAELTLTPAIVGQDGFLTTHLIESLQVPERQLIKEFLGAPDDIIDCPTPAQEMIYGKQRRRIPMSWDVDNPVSTGSVQNQDAFMQTVAAQRPYFYDHVEAIADQVMDEYQQLTGRRYDRVGCYKTDDAEYILIAQGSVIVQAEAVVDYLRKTHKIKVGVVNMRYYRPFPGNILSHILKGKKGVSVIERTDQPLAEDLPLIREIRAALSKCSDNGHAAGDAKPYPDYATFTKIEHQPRLFSGSYGLGSRDLQPGALIGVFENMMAEGRKIPFFYLSIDFVHKQADSPKQELYQQNLLESYPHLADLTIDGSENPNLMPENSITLRMHSVGGWGAITTGKNLSMTIFDLLGYYIKSNPKYGSEKKGQPTTYYLSAAPEEIKVNCEYHYVDIVLSPDPNSFEHSNPLFGLKKGGVLVIQSNLDSADKVWQSFSIKTRKEIVEKEIRVYYVDGFKIAREEAGNPDLQYRMQGTAFQGAFFVASPLMESTGLTEMDLFKAIKAQLESKFGSKGKAVVEDNLRVVQRGFDETIEITNKVIDEQHSSIARKVVNLPALLKKQKQGSAELSDIHRFWEQTGSMYMAGQGNNNIADPFLALSQVPASTGVFRDMTQIRFEHPIWNAENCTACGDCYTVCPDSAIPGLVNTVAEVFSTIVSRIETGTKGTIGHQTQFLRRTLRDVDKKLRILMEPMGDKAEVNTLLDRAILETLNESTLEEKELQTLEKELGWFMQELGDFKFASTKPYFTNKEKKAKGSGGLFSITVNPYTCKGCMMCIDVCDDDALTIVTQTPESVTKLRDEWDFWEALPTTPEEFSRIDDIDEGIGALETLLLNKRNYGSMVCGDGACLGCGEKTSIHLFTSTVTALMQPRVKKHLAHIDKLIADLEQHIRLKLAENIDLSNTHAVHDVLADNVDKDVTLSKLTSKLDEGNSNAEPIDADWLQWATQLLENLKDLQWKYAVGINNTGRSEMGFINATGCTSVWGSTFPFNPYPFPWSSNLFQDSPSVAMGLFEGHMVKMAEGFKAIRMAEMELAGGYNEVKEKEFFTYFSWKDFTDDEFHLCPPVVSVGGDGAMYDIGFQNLSRMMMSGVPIKVLIVDTQVYSNTGGQACTSGFVSQVSDMAPFNKKWKGKEEIRKEMSIIATAHRTSYVLQSSFSHISHLLEGYIEGLNSRRPAIFNVYAVCPPEHGIADDSADRQSKLAVESRAYPLFKFDPDKGTTFEECISIEGNPAIAKDWPRYTLEYLDANKKPAKLEVPLTFVDFAITEGRFRKHFRNVPEAKWSDDMVQVDEFIDMDADEQQTAIPFVWTVNSKQQLIRSLVSKELATSALERRNFWQQLKSLSGFDHKLDKETLIAQTRQEMAQSLTSNLLSMAGAGAEANTAASNLLGSAPVAASADYEAVWVDSPECTACDDCIDINPDIFTYNDQKLVVVANPQAGTFKDIVKAAEKCTAECIHPGTPFNPNEEGVDKLIKRASKFQ